MVPPAALLLCLRDHVSVAADPGGALTVEGAGRRLSISRPSPGIRLAAALLSSPVSEDELTATVANLEGAAGVAQLSYYLERLLRSGLVVRSLWSDDAHLVTIIPVASGAGAAACGLTLPELSDAPLALSRFAYLRVDAGRTLLESPLTSCRVLIADRRVAALLCDLAQPVSVAALAARTPELALPALRMLLALLLQANMLSSAEEQPSLWTWEFHDLLFHSRTRNGRHDQPVGDTYRFADRLPPAPAIKRWPDSTPAIALHRPDFDQLANAEPPFIQVHESRRSIREYAGRPIKLEELGAFLYRVGRNKRHFETDAETPNGPVRTDMVTRPYPGGGCVHELEFYVAVQRCESLDAGFYHYDPDLHRLGQLCGRTPDLDAVLEQASHVSGTQRTELQVLIILAARFARMSWKYASIAYSLILKDVGIAFQSMYLTATAMKLAPCVLGSGDSDLFARLAGTDYYAETSVGEFLLGSCS